MIRSEKRGQVTIFVIIAIVIVAGIAVFFLIRGDFGAGSIPAELQPVYDYYQTCIEKEAKSAIDLVGAQGGRIDTGVYIPGSEFAPFSNQLNFLGFPVPYWYYISGNGLIKEQVPGKTDIENEIARYVAENLPNCDFERFYAQGFEIEIGDPSVNVKIEDMKVLANVNSELVVSKDENSARQTSQEASVNSKLGKFYGIAREIYDKQKKEAFLEGYSADVLRLYAPVDGVEISCSPKIWKTGEIEDELKSGLEGNIASLKLKGGNYELNSKEDEYFVVDYNAGENVNFIYSRNWPTKIEVIGNGVDEALMVAEAVGNQEGMGVMGFCYVPYHFVYDLSFPVLIQIYNDNEIFQFPVAVVIDKNVPRKAIFSDSIDYLGNQAEEDLCEFKTQDISVNLYDINLNNVDANVSYECFDQSCSLGETQNGRIVSKAPSCVNGYLHARAGGYSEKKQLFSSNEESSADIILDREYEVKLNIEVDRNKVNENAIVVFTRSDGKSVTAVLPGSDKIKLSEGQYDVRVYVYGNSSIVIPATTTTKCQDIPKSGLFGLFGGTKEECFDIVVPETKIDHGLIGGGDTQNYLLESDLVKGEMVVNVQGFPVPNTLEQLQYNFEAFDKNYVEVNFA